jgi:hypothetical protein
MSGRSTARRGNKGQPAGDSPASPLWVDSDVMSEDLNNSFANISSSSVVSEGFPEQTLEMKYEGFCSAWNWGKEGQRVNKINCSEITPFGPSQDPWTPSNYVQLSPNVWGGVNKGKNQWTRVGDEIRIVQDPQ